MAMLLSDKSNFQTRKLTRDTEGYFIMIIGSIHQKGTIIPSVYVTHNRTSKYMKQKLIDLKKSRKIL